jgi:hypothetical protein
MMPFLLMVILENALAIGREQENRKKPIGSFSTEARTDELVIIPIGSMDRHEGIHYYQLVKLSYHYTVQAQQL